VSDLRTSRKARPKLLGVAALFAVAAITACDSNGAAATDVVGAADAITAVVAWQADEQAPVFNDQGNELLPVIFVVADSGATFGVGVQAAVAAATVDWATVRFADDVADTFDPRLEGEPVRDNGALLLIGLMPEAATSIELSLVRYGAAEAGEAFTLKITSNDASTTAGTEPRALVTAVSQP
jgi:hypothetical protein